MLLFDDNLLNEIFKYLSKKDILHVFSCCKKLKDKDYLFFNKYKIRLNIDCLEFSKLYFEKKLSEQMIKFYGKIVKLNLYIEESYQFFFGYKFFKNLKELTFYDNFDGYIENLPDTSTKLKFGNGFNQPLYYLPKSLKFLIISTNYSFDLQNFTKSICVEKIDFELKEIIKRFEMFKQIFNLDS